VLNADSTRGFMSLNVPNIFLSFVNEIAALFLCFGLIVGIGYLGAENYKSRFLLFYGEISYEIFLLHGALLVKYNPIINIATFGSLLIFFPLFVVLATLISYIFKKVRL